MSPAADAVIRRLDGARQQWWLFTLLTTAVLATSASLATLLLFMLSDTLLVFSQMVLAGMFLGWLVLTITLVVMVCRRLVRSQRSLEATARRVEYEFPELGSSLINLVQLSSDTRNENRAFCEAAVNECVSRVNRFPMEDAAKRETRWGRFRYCMQTPRDLAEAIGVLAALLVVGVACHILVPNWGSAATRLMKPWDFIPSIGRVKIVKVLPGNAEVLIGSAVEIVAEIQNPTGKPHKGTAFITSPGEDGKPEENALPMSADEKQTVYKATLPTVTKALTYRLQVGDSQTEVYTINVREKPTINEVEVRYHYPVYMGKPDEQPAVQKTADLEAPQFSVAEMRIKPNGPIAKGHVEMDGQKYVGTLEDGGKLLIVKLPLLKDANFTVNLYNDAGHTDPDPRVNRMHVIVDKPPTVQILKPAGQTAVAPGADVPVMLRANDDYAVGYVKLEMKVDKAAPAEGATPAPDTQGIVTLNEWSKFDGTTTVMLNHRLELPKDKIGAGDVVRIRAVAADKRAISEWGVDLKPQETVGSWCMIRVVAEKAQTDATLEQLDNLKSNLWKILEAQIRARVKSTMLIKKDSLDDRMLTAGEIRAEQVSIHKLTGEFIASIKTGDNKEKQEAKQVLGKLAVGDMTDAVKMCDGLVKVKTAEGFVEPMPKLVATQDRIIETLRKLMDSARRAQSDVLQEEGKRSTSDLPADAKAKLEAAQKKLEEFMKTQKKVIEATQELAKKPVEDFTEKEEEALKGLAAAQDEWSKLMQELLSDLSKLPEQDFANSSMAKELNEIQTQLKMAEDALTKKATDIAVPLEQLGYEMAKEISSNMEKWLPDKADRERWSQEESMSDQDKEAPMAELPSELEDLIGELAEQEEDLMEEAQDISSSAIDSLDKGAGWDVLDGPISNNSAKGATGNQLPNTNEIGGRSGEGRSAKSSGEFVGDEAVGKGGRKTPSRLTPDPFVKGQIKDHSKDPQGGATGGGKESGKGGEGLEGPGGRDQGSRDQQRLAGKQAALRNKAEGVDVQFQVNNFHRTDLKKMIDLMAQIERDLKAGRPINILRQKQALADSAANVKQQLQGEFQVRQDASVNLPTEIQKEILGSMADPSPVGWEELNREYFERLAGSSGAAGMAPPPVSDAGGDPTKGPTK